MQYRLSTYAFLGTCNQRSNSLCRNSWRFGVLPIGRRAVLCIWRHGVGKVRDSETVAGSSGASSWASLSEVVLEADARSELTARERLLLAAQRRLHGLRYDFCRQPIPVTGHAPRKEPNEFDV